MMTTSTAFDAEEHAASVLPVRREDLVLEELDGKAILYDSRNGAVHRFNALTLFVWDTCDGSCALADIAHHLTHLCDVEPDEALESVHRVIAELTALDLVQGASVAPMNESTIPQWTKARSEPTASNLSSMVGLPQELRLSRRMLLHGGVSKLAFVAPVISTFFASGAFASGVSASAAFGDGGCKNVGYSCAVNNDCCEGGTRTACQVDTCCVQHLQTGCKTDGDCCNAPDICIAETCQ